MSPNTESWAALEAEYRAKAGSSKPEDIERCRQIKRELERMTTEFLRAAGA